MLHLFKKSKNVLLLLINFYLCCVICACTKIEHNAFSKRPDFSSPSEVEVVKIEASNIKKELKATGTLESPQSTELTSEIAGKIIYLNIPEGKPVGSGHVLARVNDITNKAEIEVAKAKLENAQTNYNRMKSLREKGAISQQSLDNTLEILRISEGEFNRVSSINSMTEIVAPFSGVLSIRKISLGQYIDPGDPIVRISQINPLYLIVNLPEQYVSQVKTDQNIKFTVSNSLKEFTAKVIVIDPYIDPNTRSVQIKAIVQNPKRELLPGRFANVSLETSGIPNAISIPEEALIQEGSKKQVAVVSKDNTVIFKEVTVSKWDRDSIVISDGLMIGDVVITSGHQKVHPGSKVTPKLFNTIHNPILDKEVHDTT